MKTSACQGGAGAVFIGGGYPLSDKGKILQRLKLALVPGKQLHFQFETVLYEGLVYKSLRYEMAIPIRWIGGPEFCVGLKK